MAYHQDLQVMTHLKSFVCVRFMNGLVHHMAIMVSHVTEDDSKDEELRELNHRFQE